MRRIAIALIFIGLGGCSALFNGDDLTGTHGAGDGGGDQGVGDDLGDGGSTEDGPKTCQTGAGPLAFTTKGPYMTGGDGQIAPVVGHFDPGPTLDIAVPNLYSASVGVLVGAGDGTFTLSSSSPVSVCKGPDALAAGDFDGKNGDDLFVVCYDTSVSPAVTAGAILLNDGAGGFTKTVVNILGSGPQDIAAGDFDQDGKLDVAIVFAASKEVRILFGDGAGAFPANLQLPITAGTTPSPDGIGIGFFNADAIPDIAVSDYNGGNLSVFLSDLTTKRKFNANPPITSLSFLGAPRAVDVNNDHVDDLVVLSGYSPTAEIEIFLNAGTGSFPSMPVSPGPRAGCNQTMIAVGNLSCNGKVDLVTTGYITDTLGCSVASAASNQVSVRKHMASTFVTAADQTVPYANGVAVGDFNGDLLDDAVITQIDNSTVTVLLSHN
jgi:hypothetical protein